VALMMNSIIGAGIFGLPSLLAARLGGYAPLGAVVAGAGILIIAACIAEVSSRFEKTGGMYLYTREAFGRFAGMLIGWQMSLMRISAPAASADLFVTYARQFVPALRGRGTEIIVIAVLIGHLALLNYIGVKTGKVVSNIFTAIKVGILVMFIGGGLLELMLHPNLRVPLILGPTTLRNWSEACLLLVYAYGGFEGAMLVGGETRNPKRDMPFALLAALVLQCFLYTGVLYVVIATLPRAGESVRPLADAAQRFLGGWGAAAIGVAALVSTYGYLSANLLHAPRVTFALGEQGDFPAFFARIHPRFRTPHVSILLYAALLFAFSALGNFRWNAMLSAVSRLVVYGAMAAAVPVLRRKSGRAPFSLSGAPLFWGMGFLISMVLLSRMGRGEGIVVAVTAAIALANWVLMKGKKEVTAVADTN
jgi:basic amino acid/polyamine antiporter, APA family